MNPRFPAQGAPFLSPARCSRTGYASALLPPLSFSFFPLVFVVEGGRGREVKAPLGDRAGLSHASAPAQDSQISRSRIRAGGPGRRPVCPGPGEPHLKGSGPPLREPCRAEPHRPRWDPAGARLCLDGEDGERGSPPSPAKKQPYPPGRAAPGPTQPV